MSSKFLIIGDLHGNKPKVYFKDFDAIIAPGDFCSDKGIRKWKNRWVKTLKQNKTDESMYAFIVSKIGKRRYNQLEKESLKIGRKILEYLNAFNKPVFIIPGNWDQSYAISKVIIDEETSGY